MILDYMVLNSVNFGLMWIWMKCQVIALQIRVNYRCLESVCAVIAFGAYIMMWRFRDLTKDAMKAECTQLCVNGNVVYRYPEN